MFWIKLCISLLIILNLTTGCSHRFKRSVYFQKSKNSSRKNYFDYRYADKSRKVRINDEYMMTQSQPNTKTSIITSKAKKHPTMRPYLINNKRYFPSVVVAGSTFKGVASWYGPDFNGKLTSNGENYDMYAFTAAHKTLPMHTIVRVTNLENSKQVTVRINDRGPFVKNRIIDLSKAAAKTISMTTKGTAYVKLKILGFNDDKNHVKTKSPNKTKQIVKEHRVQNGPVYVQIGSFSFLEGAQIYQKRFDTLEEKYKSVIKEQGFSNNKIYKVLISGFVNEQEARDYIQTHNGFTNAFIVRD